MSLWYQTITIKFVRNNKYHKKYENVYLFNKMSKKITFKSIFCGQWMGRIRRILAW